MGIGSLLLSSRVLLALLLLLPSQLFLIMLRYTLFFLLLVPNTMSFYYMRAQGRNQADLVYKLAQAGVVKSAEIREVLGKVDRKNFAGSYMEEDSYVDMPLPIGCEQTISAPHMHAHALEQMLPALKKSKADRVTILDVGCGSGYLTAALGRLVDDKNGEPVLGKPGKVFGIDVYPELVDGTRRNIEKEDADLLTNGIVEVSVGDGWKGLPDKSPFDAIHVGAAADKFPEQLLMQLRVGGVLIVPVGVYDQAIYKVQRLAESSKFREKDFRKQRLFGVRYVPLVHTD